MENFNYPYIAKSITDFWRRWHISLSTWFRDYLYIPLGGNRKGTIRKYINTMIVFLVSGLWHGASWTYVIWGGLNGLYQVIGSLFSPVKHKFAVHFPKLDSSKGMRLLRMAATFVLVDFTWIFFRAHNFAQVKSVFLRIMNMNNPDLLANGMLFDLGLNKQNFVVLGIALIILLAADIAKYNHIKLHEEILGWNIVARWSVILIAVMSILVFGIWGSGYQATNFIYFQF